MLCVLLHYWPIRTEILDVSPERREVWSLCRFLFPAADYDSLQFLYTLRWVYVRPQWATASPPDPLHNLWKTDRERVTNSPVQLSIWNGLPYVMKRGFIERGRGVYYHTSSTEVTVWDVERPSTIYYLLSDNGKTVDVTLLSTITIRLPQQLRCSPQQSLKWKDISKSKQNYLHFAFMCATYLCFMYWALN